MTFSTQFLVYVALSSLDETLTQWIIYKKSWIGEKTDPPLPPWKAQCTDATLLQLKSAATTLGPPKEEKTSIGGTKGKFLKKKIGKIFFNETFLMKKSKDIWCIPFRKIKCKKLCAKKFSTQKIVENEQFWFFGRFLAFWAPKWPKIGPKIGPNIKFEFWIPRSQ